MKNLILLIFTVTSTFAASGSWNGVAFTQWNGIAQTSWNGTGISCAGGGGSVSFESVSSVTGFFQHSTASPKTYTHAIGNLTSGYAVVAISTYSASITSATWDSTGSAHAMTQIATITHPTETALKTFLYGVPLGNKASGTYTISIAITGSGVEFSSASMTFNNVHQTTSTGTAGTATGTSATPSVNVTSAAGEMVVDVISYYSGDPSAPGAGQTERWEYASGSSITDGASSTEAGAASVTMSWSISGGGSVNWTICAIPLKPAS